MGQHPIHGRLIIIRPHLQGGIGPDLFSMFGHHNGLLSTVGPGPGNHRNPAPGFFNGNFDDLVMFFVIKGRGLAGGSARDQSIDLFLLNQIIDQAAKSVFIQMRNRL